MSGPMPGSRGGKALVGEGDFALAQRFGATGAKVLIDVLVGQDKQ